MTKLRARALGLPCPGTPGPLNAITDIAGLGVGFTTIISLDGQVPQIRTGVTAIVPHLAETAPLCTWAGFHALNGNGEMTGTHWVEDAGLIRGPVLITNTHSVGIVHHAAVRWMMTRYAEALAGHHFWAMPVVAETYDGTLNDINGLHVTEADALAALEAARPGPVAEGNVGGGTGMIAYDWKGGTGTSSRQVAVAGRKGIVAALVQANHGRGEWLTVLGVPVGKELRPESLRAKETGSIIVVLATDLPLLPHQLRRLAKRASLGIGRGGTPGGNSSGDIFLALSTANAMLTPELAPPVWQLEAISDEAFDPIYMAAVEAIEESVLNAMLAAEDTPSLRPAGHVVRGIPHDALLRVMRRYNRVV
jgi:D-aminopeptidase